MENTQSIPKLHLHVARGIIYLGLSQGLVEYQETGIKKLQYATKVMNVTYYSNNSK